MEPAANPQTAEDTDRKCITFPRAPHSLQSEYGISWEDGGGMHLQATRPTAPLNWRMLMHGSQCLLPFVEEVDVGY